MKSFSTPILALLFLSAVASASFASQNVKWAATTTNPSFSSVAMDQDGGDQDGGDQDSTIPGWDAGAQTFITSESINELAREQLDEVFGWFDPLPVADRDGRLGNMWVGVDWSLSNMTFKNFRFEEYNAEFQLAEPNRLILDIVDMQCETKFDYHVDSALFDLTDDGKAKFKSLDLHLVYELAFKDGAYSANVQDIEVTINKLKVQFGHNFWDSISSWIAHWIVDSFKDLLADDIADVFGKIATQAAQRMIEAQAQRHWVNDSQTVGIDFTPIEGGVSIVDDAIQTIRSGTFFTAFLDANTWDDNFPSPLAQLSSSNEGIELSINEYSLNSFGWLWFHDNQLSQDSFDVEIEYGEIDSNGLATPKLLSISQKSGSNDYTLSTNMSGEEPNFLIQAESVLLELTQNATLSHEDSSDSLFEATWTVQLALEPEVSDDTKISFDIEDASVTSLVINSSSADWSEDRITSVMNSFLEHWTESLEDNLLDDGFSLNFLTGVDIEFEDITLRDENLVVSMYFDN